MFEKFDGKNAAAQALFLSSLHPISVCKSPKGIPQMRSSSFESVGFSFNPVVLSIELQSGSECLTARTWHKFLDDFVDDADLVSRIMGQSPR